MLSGSDEANGQQCDCIRQTQGPTFTQVAGWQLVVLLIVTAL